MFILEQMELVLDEFSNHLIEPGSRNKTEIKYVNIYVSWRIQEVIMHINIFFSN